MRVPKPTSIDFETHGVEDRPCYPPVPVGVSIKPWGRRSRYLAWGHRTGNNCSWGDARQALAEAYQCKDGVLFHNAKFDLDVAEVEFGLEIPEWQLIHDTMLLLFLQDPNQRELSLKPSAERLLGIKPDERDAVRDWLLARQPLQHRGIKITDSKSGEHGFGRYISLAPGNLVGRYAEGDTDRTTQLFSLVYQDIASREMLAAYDRERRLLPILLRMERRGIQVAQRKLEADVAVLNDARRRVDEWLIKRLNAPADVNFNSGKQLVDLLVADGAASVEDLGVTESGTVRTDKAALESAIGDAQLRAMLRYRGALNTSVGTFLEPWAKMAKRSGGRIYTTWHQVRGGESGARTGRLSATWFMNMPKDFEPLFKHQASDPATRKKLPAAPIKNLPSLPSCRSYIIPFDGHVIIDRDYSQQEPRILAHFDGGQLMIRYQTQPWTDLHDYARDELIKVGLIYDRRPVKNTNLGLIYGMGVGSLAERNNMAFNEAKQLKANVLSLYPGLSEMYTDMRGRAARNEPIRTWGGREYYCEPPKLVKGQWRKFDYKLVNVLIQGSGSDCTKEAIIAWDEAVTKLGHSDDWFLILNVHDQLTSSVPKQHRDAAMKVLKDSMESVKFDVPMLTEGAWSPDSWGTLRDYDKKGVRCK